MEGCHVSKVVFDVEVVGSSPSDSVRIFHFNWYVTPTFKRFGVEILIVKVRFSDLMI